MGTDEMGATALEDLFLAIETRRREGGADSYTRQLLEKGASAVARKVGEEALETVIASLSGDRDEVIAESADLLYHWLVLMASLQIAPSEVYAELRRRGAARGGGGV